MIKLLRKDRERAQDALNCLCKTDQRGDKERLAVLMHDVRVVTRVETVERVRAILDKCAKATNPHAAIGRELFLLAQTDYKESV